MDKETALALISGFAKLADANNRRATEIEQLQKRLERLEDSVHDRSRRETTRMEVFF